MPLLKKFETEGSQLTPLTGNQPSAFFKGAPGWFPFKGVN